MKKGIIVAGILGIVGVFLITKAVKGARCYVVDNIGTGPSAPYYYATYLGKTMPIIDAFGETNNDIFTVEFLVDYLYQPVNAYDIIPEGQEFRFQVVRTTEICNINLEE